VDGRVLTFRLIGINNQNFLMEDLETRSWWQQVSGEAVHGPLRGRRLAPVLHDEVSFGLWQREHRNGRVLALADPAAQIRADWDVRTAQMPVVVPSKPTDPLPPRALVVGLVVQGRAKAYPMDLLTRTRAVMDRIGTTPVAILVGADGRSTRAFDRRVDGRALELMSRPGASPARFVDTETGSEWDMSGTAIAGPLAGRKLPRLLSLSDYWFDWHLYHPDTAVYREWQPQTEP